MEALAGIIYPDPFQMNGSIQSMLEIIKHRGGEEIYSYSFRNIELGIAGKSYAHNSKKTLFLALDGSIDNIHEIKEKLKRKGFLKGESKVADILLCAYLCWNEKFLEKLTGAFAIMLLDQQKEHLILARDRVGIRPLYWYQHHNTLIFGSELKALMASKKIPQTPALDAFSTYLYLGFIPQDMSPIEGINKLLPAHYLQFHFDGSLYIHNYWSYSSFFEKRIEMPKTEVAIHLEELLAKSVKNQFTDEDPLGCLLPGGLGSSSIALYLSRFVKNQEIIGFTPNFKGENDLDVDIAKNVSQKLNIEHQTETISPENFLDDFVKIAWYLEEPNADPTLIGTWNIAKNAQNKVKTLYSSIGSDEFLAGHSRYTLSEQRLSTFSRIINKTFPIIRSLLFPIFKLLYRKFAFQLLRSKPTNLAQYEFISQKALFSDKLMSYASPKLAGIFDPEVFLHKFYHLSRVTSTTDSFLYFDVKTSLPDNLILQHDRLLCSHHLNWKTPYLNRDIIEFLASIPNPEVLVEEEAASFLKAIVKEDLPKIITERAKRTRRYFLCNWMEKPPIKKQLKKLTNGILVETGLIEKNWLKEQLELLGSKPETCKRIWTLFCLEVWYRLYINRPIADNPPFITLDELFES